MSPHLKGLSRSSGTKGTEAFFYLVSDPKQKQMQLSNKDNKPLNILVYAYLLKSLDW